MKWITEDSLRNFPFWGGARENVQRMSDEEFDTIEAVLDDGKHEWTYTKINDLFWFDFDSVCYILGYSDAENYEADVTETDVEIAEEWKEMLADDMVGMQNTLPDDIIHKWIDSDLETEEIQEGMYDDLCEWWDELTDIQKVDIYRKNND